MLPRIVLDSLQIWQELPELPPTVIGKQLQGADLSRFKRPPFRLDLLVDPLDIGQSTVCVDLLAQVLPVLPPIRGKPRASLWCISHLRAPCSPSYEHEPVLMALD